MLLFLGAELKLIHQFEGVAQGVAALELAFDLAENLTDLVLDGVRGGGPLLESSEVGEELVVDVGDEVVAGQGVVVVEAAILLPWGGPFGPAMGPVDDVGVVLAEKLGLHGAFGFQVIKVLEEEHP